MAAWIAQGFLRQWDDPGNKEDGWTHCMLVQRLNWLTKRTDSSLCLSVCHENHRNSSQDKQTSVPCNSDFFCGWRGDPHVTRGDNMQTVHTDTVTTGSVTIRVLEARSVSREQFLGYRGQPKRAERGKATAAHSWSKCTGEIKLLGNKNPKVIIICICHQNIFLNLWLHFTSLSNQSKFSSLCIGEVCTLTESAYKLL